MLAKKPQGATAKRQGNPFASLMWMFVGAILVIMIGVALYLFNPFETSSDSTDTEGQSALSNDAGGAVSEQEPANFEFYDLLPQQEITSIPDEAIVIQEMPDDFALEPDVIVTLPSPEQSTQDSPTDITNEYGIARDNSQNPFQSQTPNAGTGDSEIVIVEEAGTYDGEEGAGNSGTSNNTSNTTVPSNTTVTSNTTTVTSNTNSNTASTRRAATGESGAEPVVTYLLQIHSYANAQEADKRRAQVLMAGVDARVIKNRLENGQTLYQVVSAPLTSQMAVIAAQQRLQNNGIDSLIVEQRR